MRNIVQQINRTKRCKMLNPGNILNQLLKIARIVFVMMTVLPGQGYAQSPEIEPKADQILQAMSNYLGKLKQFSAQTENSIDVILNDGEKIQYNNPVDLSVQRPDKVRAARRGDIISQEFYYDGKSLTLYEKDSNCYATVQAPATIEEMLDFARNSLDVYAPAGDLVYRDSYKFLTQDVLSGAYVGLGVVDGVRCHHLAFRSSEVDWQIWIEEGGKPLPKRLIITSKWITGAPQFTVTLKNWNLSPGLSEDDFRFSPSKDMQRIDFIQLAGEETTLR